MQEKLPRKVSCWYPGYEGKKQFEVKHPDFKRSVLVHAPDEASSIWTAAALWGVKWTDYGFYAECEVLKA